MTLHTNNARITVQVDEAYACCVDTTDLVDAAAAALDHVHCTANTLTVTITSDETVRELNKRYRNVDAPTDVLSFANHEDAGATNDGESQDIVLPPELADDMAAYLGDIVVACPYAERQAAYYGNEVAAELRLLVVHGTLHLLGHDHDTPSARSRMWSLQDAILAQFGDVEFSHRSYD